MYCEGCGKSQMHPGKHTPGSYGGSWCRSCRNRDEQDDPFCVSCGDRKSETNSLCDDHGITPVAAVDDDSGSPPATYSDSDSLHAGSLDNDDDDEDNQAMVPYSPAELNSSRALSARAADDRRQCLICNLWFDDDTELQRHKENNVMFCSQHKVCFPRSGSYSHAHAKHHTKCFIPGCPSLFAKHSDWDDVQIVNHVWREHTPKG